MARVYGIKIALDGCGINADSIQQMTDEQKRELIEKAGVDGEVYEIESFFYYLNTDMIDTENMYWVVI